MLTRIIFEDGSSRDVKDYELCRIIDGFLEAKYKFHSEYFNVDKIISFIQFDQHE